MSSPETRCQPGPASCVSSEGHPPVTTPGGDTVSDLLVEEGLVWGPSVGPLAAIALPPHPKGRRGQGTGCPWGSSKAVR